MTREESHPDDAKRRLRRLHGEPAADSARRRPLEGESRVERLWRALEPPPTSQLPESFAADTATELRRRRAQAFWSSAPPWVRAAAAASLMLGLLAGLGLGAGPDGAEVPVSEDAEAAESWPADWTGEAWTEGSWTVACDEAAWHEAFEASFGEPR